MTNNPKLDPIWNAVPLSKRYTIGGKRWVEVERGGRFVLVPLAEVAEGEG